MIARESQPIVLATLTAAVVVHYVYDWSGALPLWAVVLLLVALFRNPSRSVPAVPLAVVSPVDGRVVDVQTTQDSYLDRDAVCISVLMNLSSVYYSRSPVEGKVMRLWITPGEHRSLSNPRAASLNQRTALWLHTDEGDDVVMVMLFGPFSRPRCQAHAGERLGQGQRCGYIPFGGRVDVLLPEVTRVEVKTGDRVLAGSDIIARLVHK
jgi:phosphatidylserine decarboxylase